jgi:hypothetical protein
MAAKLTALMCMGLGLALIAFVCIIATRCFYWQMC